jgi:hypothetical protein
MLNDTNITKENLYSETNININTENLSIIKNIYETLFFNFTNVINVIDEDEGKSYPAIANYVNTNINTGTQTNYTNTQCSKYRINYVDNTTSIGNLTWKSINKYNKVTNISLYVDKAMSSIDLISNDETTVYLNIPLEVTIGKYYTLTQKIRTNDKPIPLQLQYNNEDIMYNNKNVMVYVKED